MSHTPEAIVAGATAITHIYEQDIPDSVVALMREKGAWLIPTMTVQSELLNINEDLSILDSPLLSAIATGALLRAYRTMSPTDPFAKAWLGWQKSGRVSYRRSLQKIARANIKVMTGTDSGNPGVFQGYSVHRELVIMKNLGFTTWQILQAATTLPGAFLQKDFGIRRGSIANLLVLDKSPLQDIQNTQAINMVIQRGHPVDRAKLVQKIEVPIPKSTPVAAQSSLHVH